MTGFQVVVSSEEDNYASLNVVDELFNEESNLAEGVVQFFGILIGKPVRPTLEIFGYNRSQNSWLVPYILGLMNYWKRGV